ncbi:MAG: hydantoinase B/oxoprolinase family protein [Alphaproteobacteria bacterium]|nr:hydantoinase B/oxoprolinase family protein [Alphaproteobacteria bacterium]
MPHDPVRLELIKNAIGSVVDEMVLTIIRIAYSSIMKDTMDLSSAFCDRRGRMIAQGLSLPLHLGSVPDAMDAVIAKYGDTLEPGDIVILNDPYQGGMHLPDIFMFKPVFVDDRLLGYAMLVAHHNDMGGRVPGSSAADSTEIFQEGLRIPILKLYERGQPNQTLMDMIAINVRIPDVVLGDLQAQVAACRIAERGMRELAARHGVDALEGYFDELLDYSEREARRTIRAIPDGVYRFVDKLDDDGVNMDQPVTIAVAVHIAGDELTVDLTGTSPQVHGAINSTLSFAKSAVYFAVRSIMDSDAPNNAGFFRPIHVKAPLGCLVNPRPPAAVAARGISGFRLIDAMFGAIAQAMPGAVRAAGEGGTTSYSFGCYDAEGRFSLFREAVMGAWGAGLRREGIDGVANAAANISNAPIEMVENQAPIRVERYELVPDSGGPGEWRGGMSVMRQLRFLGERATLQLRSDRRHNPPYGLMGGSHGQPSNNMLEDKGSWSQIPTKFTRALSKGQAIRHTTAGAGGYGDPLHRDPALVMHDVRNGKVTPEAAKRDYGVVVLANPLRIDDSATAQLRTRQAQHRVAAAQ